MINAKKSFGQNFLKDENVINKIIDSVSANELDLIIEIGPGKGALTRELKQKQGKLIAFEIDTRMREILSSLEDDNTKIIYEDILSVDLNKIIKNYNPGHTYVVANLPYYITSPIVEKLINLDLIDEMTIMVQKEVADRYLALPKTKEYGMMSVLIQSKYNVSKICNVKNTSFDPIPKVDSAVIRLSLKDIKKRDFNFDSLRKLTSLAFMHKRKTLKNNLPNNIWEKAYKYLQTKGYTERVRAEEINVEDYTTLSNIINL